MMSPELRVLCLGCLLVLVVLLHPKVDWLWFPDRMTMRKKWWKSRAHLTTRIEFHGPSSGTRKWREDCGFLSPNDLPTGAFRVPPEFTPCRPCGGYSWHVPYVGPTGMRAWVCPGCEHAVAQQPFREADVIALPVAPKRSAA